MMFLFRWLMYCALLHHNGLKTTISFVYHRIGKKYISLVLSSLAGPFQQCIFIHSPILPRYYSTFITINKIELILNDHKMETI